MSKIRSVKATYSDTVARQLFGTPASARKTVATILKSRSSGKESFTLDGKTYRSVAAGTLAPQKKK